MKILVVEDNPKLLKLLSHLLEKEGFQIVSATSGKEALATYSHDLKSVRGLIGMQQTSAIAAAIQNDCLNKELERLPDAIQKLSETVPAEAAEALKIAQELPES